jgi:hypothetical protein
VSLADFFDLRLFGPREVAEVVEESLGLSRCKSLADEWTYVLVVADG